ncbi:NUDIX hydrolase [Bergeriella denitrificans]|nr:CoA pyrophosphatase [Bergeriella denitrificans]
MMTTSELTRFLSLAAGSPVARETLRNRILQEEARQWRQAAVLLPVVHDGTQWQLLLTRRADTLRHHTGQIALPGGGREAGDADFTQTALRETCEETGLPADAWQTFPVLPPHYTPSGYEVHPVPALYCGRNPPEPQPDSREVAEVFYLPLTDALNPARYGERLLETKGHRISTPTLSYRHYDIWGLTAIILYGLAERYQAHLRQAV